MSATLEKKTLLADFAEYLSKNHLEEIARLNIRLAIEEKVPLLRFFEGLSEDQLIKTGMEGLKTFLKGLQAGTATEEIYQSIDNWKNDKLPGIPREEVEICDLVLINAHRNKNIRKFIHLFTSDVTSAIEIIEELDRLHVYYNNLAFTAFMDIQKEVLERKNILIIQNEGKLKEAQEIGLLGSWEFDVVNNEVSWSDQMYRIFGYEPGEIQIDFEKYLTLLHPDDRTMVSDKVSGIFKTLEPYTFEHRLIKKDGTIAWVLARGKVLEKNGDHVLKIAGTGQDITEEKNYQEVLEKRQRSLEAVNKELEAFCYTISHDLRSPLRAIDGFGKMLAEDYTDKLDKEGVRILDVIRNNAQFMGSLIDDLLDFSRLNRKDLVKNRFEMKVMVESVLEELKQANPENNAKVILKDLPEAFADKTMIHQVWQNLLSNAFKFTSKKEQGIIEIGSKEGESENIYYVKDNGAGFDMKYKNKLFHVFQRLHSMEEFTGTGVGLATVQRIILRNGGTVWADGAVNEGATFYFSLPCN